MLVEGRPPPVGCLSRSPSRSWWWSVNARRFQYVQPRVHACTKWGAISLLVFFGVSLENADAIVCLFFCTYQVYIRKSVNVRMRASMICMHHHQAVDGQSLSRTRWFLLFLDWIIQLFYIRIYVHSSQLRRKYLPGGVLEYLLCVTREFNPLIILIVDTLNLALCVTRVGRASIDFFLVKDTWCMSSSMARLYVDVAMNIVTTRPGRMHLYIWADFCCRSTAVFLSACMFFYRGP